MKKYLLLTALLSGLSISGMAADHSSIIPTTPILDLQSSTSPTKSDVLYSGKLVVEEKSKASKHILCVENICGYNAGCLIYSDISDAYEWISLLQFEHCP